MGYSLNPLLQETGCAPLSHEKFKASAGSTPSHEPPPSRLQALMFVHMSLVGQDGRPVGPERASEGESKAPVGELLRAGLGLRENVMTSIPYCDSVSLSQGSTAACSSIAGQMRCPKTAPGLNRCFHT